MAATKEVVEDTLRQAMDEVACKTYGLDLSEVERLALAWMVIQYSGYLHTHEDIPSLMEAVIRHPDRYSVHTVHGLMLASPIARELLSRRIDYFPSRAQQRRIEGIFRKLASSHQSR